MHCMDWFWSLVRPFLSLHLYTPSLGFIHSRTHPPPWLYLYHPSFIEKDSTSNSLLAKLKKDKQAKHPHDTRVRISKIHTSYAMPRWDKLGVYPQVLCIEHKNLSINGTKEEVIINKKIQGRTLSSFISTHNQTLLVVLTKHQVGSVEIPTF